MPHTRTRVHGESGAAGSAWARFAGGHRRKIDDLVLAMPVQVDDEVDDVPAGAAVCVRIVPGALSVLR